MSHTCITVKIGKKEIIYVPSRVILHSYRGVHIRLWATMTVIIQVVKAGRKRLKRNYLTIIKVNSVQYFSRLFFLALLPKSYVRAQ